MVIDITIANGMHQSCEPNERRLHRIEKKGSRGGQGKKQATSDTRGGFSIRELVSAQIR